MSIKSINFTNIKHTRVLHILVGDYNTKQTNYILRVFFGISNSNLGRNKMEREFGLLSSVIYFIYFYNIV